MTVPPVIQPSSIKLRINLKGEGKNMKRAQERNATQLGLLAVREKEKKVP